ncbi:MAG: HNH endonuclease, partial [Bacteroidales bacterium]|nr:HNH endonuclease [Bacteroidales bacterium]
GHNIDSIRTDANIDTPEEFKIIVNKLGNKILLEDDINKSIGREWFMTKKQQSITTKTGYKDSKFGLALSLVNYEQDKWTKEDIEKCTKKVADRIVDFIFCKE